MRLDFDVHIHIHPWISLPILSCEAWSPTSLSPSPSSLLPSLSLQAFGRFAPQRARVSSMHLSSSKYSLTSQWGVHEWVRVRVREFACECVFLDEHSASIRTQQNKWIVTKKLNSKEFRVSWAKLTAALSLFWGKNRLGKLPFTVFVFLLIFLYTYIWSLVAKRAL